MIALDAPAALVGLAALPVLYWLHRRRTRALPVVVPSLRFLDPDDDAQREARTQRLDLNLLLSLLGAAAVALAAAGPRVRASHAPKTVRVVVDEGVAMAARSADGTTARERAEQVVDTLRALLRTGEDLVRAFGPGDPADRAERGRAALRLVVTDRARDAGPGVIVVAVGDPDGRNAGIVAAAPAELPDPPDPEASGDGAAGRAVFVTVRNDAPVARALRLTAEGGASAAFDVPAFGLVSRTLAVPAGEGPIRVTLSDPDGALAADDRVTLDVAPPSVAVAGPDAGLPEAHGALVRATLDVVAPGWKPAPPSAARLRIGARATEVAGGVDVVLRPVPPGGASVRAPRGAPRERPPSPYGDDLDPVGLDLVYAPDPRLPAASDGSGRGDPGRAPDADPAPWPLLRVGVGPAGASRVEVCFDPLLGVPPPADTALWPLLLDNVVQAAVGTPTSGGARVLGLLPHEATRLGRDRVPLDREAVRRALDAAPPDGVPPSFPLRAPLLVLAAVSWGLLWRREGRAAVA